MSKQYANSPIAVIGIASPKSTGSAAKVKAKYGAEFPNGVDLGGATFILWKVHPQKSFGFVVDEQGKIIYGYDLGFVLTASKKSFFAECATRYLRGATDPFGITEIPAACKAAYAHLKVGRFAMARTLAKRLARSGDSAVKEVAEQIIAAADETEKKKIELMQGLADAGRAGELQEEIDAFALAFPMSREKSKLRSLLSKAKATADGRKEYMAATNFKKALSLLKGNRKRAATFLDALAQQFEGTYHGKLAAALASGLWKLK